MHSPWVSRLLSELGHEVIVTHARNVRLIGESRKKHDRLDAQMLARLARIDPQLLCPVKHRSRKAQANLTVIGSQIERSRDCSVANAIAFAGVRLLAASFARLFARTGLRDPFISSTNGRFRSAPAQP